MVYVLVATVLTVYGIETGAVLDLGNSILILLQQYLPFTVLKQLYTGSIFNSIQLQQYLPFTVLKRERDFERSILCFIYVATVLTVYGIETYIEHQTLDSQGFDLLQQYLPFTVLKLVNLLKIINKNSFYVATVLTVYGIETNLKNPALDPIVDSCNSTYRLRY